jgi:hypothetical protein
MDIVEKLRFYVIGRSDIDDAADEIERLREEVLMWGDFIDMFPHGNLEWQYSTPMPPEFALKLHSEWWNKARDAFAGSQYYKLYRQREALGEKE